MIWNFRIVYVWGARKILLLTVSNCWTASGGTTIPDVKVIDSRLGFVALDRTYLNPGEVAVGSANYTIGQEDAPGPINDTVWASGSDLRRNAVTVNANVSVELVLPPALDLDQGPVNEVPPSPGNSWRGHVVRLVQPLFLNRKRKRMRFLCDSSKKRFILWRRNYSHKPKDWYNIALIYCHA